MYLCEQCKQQVPANSSSYLFPLQIRKKAYPKRSKVNKYHHNHRLEYRDDRGGEGFEWVKALRVCPDCYQQLTKHSSLNKKE